MVRATSRVSTYFDVIIKKKFSDSSVDLADDNGSHAPLIGVEAENLNPPPPADDICQRVKNFCIKHKVVFLVIFSLCVIFLISGVIFGTIKHAAPPQPTTDPHEEFREAPPLKVGFFPIRLFI